MNRYFESLLYFTLLISRTSHSMSNLRHHQSRWTLVHCHYGQIWSYSVRSKDLISPADTFPSQVHRIYFESPGANFKRGCARYSRGFTRHAGCVSPSTVLMIFSNNFILSSLGHAFLEKNLFSEYNFNLPKITGDNADYTQDDDAEELDSTVSFGISLSALLECLQIFGADSSRERWGQGGFGTTMEHSTSDNHLTRPTGTCDFIYRGEGHTLDLMWISTMF